jgi:hypothetical protein
MRIRSMIALAVVGALAMVALVLPATIPASADDDDHSNHHRHGGHDRPSLGSGGKITLKLLERGESQTLAEIYASEDTSKKVERAMRRGLIVHCHPGGYDTLSFTCEGATTPRPDTTVPDTTVPDTTGPDTTVPDTTGPDTTGPATTVSATTP